MPTRCAQWDLLAQVGGCSPTGRHPGARALFSLSRASLCLRNIRGWLLSVVDLELRQVPLPSVRVCNQRKDQNSKCGFY